MFENGLPEEELIEEQKKKLMIYKPNLKRADLLVAKFHNKILDKLGINDREQWNDLIETLIAGNKRDKFSRFGGQFATNLAASVFLIILYTQKELEPLKELLRSSIDQIPESDDRLFLGDKKTDLMNRLKDTWYFASSQIRPIVKTHKEEDIDFYRKFCERIVILLNTKPNNYWSSFTLIHIEKSDSVKANSENDLAHSNLDEHNLNDDVKIENNEEKDENKIYKKRVSQRIREHLKLIKEENEKKKKSVTQSHQRSLIAQIKDFLCLESPTETFFLAIQEKRRLLSAYEDSLNFISGVCQSSSCLTSDALRFMIKIFRPDSHNRTYLLPDFGGINLQELKTKLNSFGSLIEKITEVLTSSSNLETKLLALDCLKFNFRGRESFLVTKIDIKKIWEKNKEQILKDEFFRSSVLEVLDTINQFCKRKIHDLQENSNLDYMKQRKQSSHVDDSELGKLLKETLETLVGQLRSSWKELEKFSEKFIKNSLFKIYKKDRRPERQRLAPLMGLMFDQEYPDKEIGSEKHFFKFEEGKPHILNNRENMADTSDVAAKSFVEVMRKANNEFRVVESCLVELEKLAAQLKDSVCVFFVDRDNLEPIIRFVIEEKISNNRIQKLGCNLLAKLLENVDVTVLDEIFEEKKPKTDEDKLEEMNETEKSQGIENNEKDDSNLKEEKIKEENDLKTDKEDKNEIKENSIENENIQKEKLIYKKNFIYRILSKYLVQRRNNNSKFYLDNLARFVRMLLNTQKTKKKTLEAFKLYIDIHPSNKTKIKILKLLSPISGQGDIQGELCTISGDLTQAVYLILSQNLIYHSKNYLKEDYKIHFQLNKKLAKEQDFATYFQRIPVLNLRNFEVELVREENLKIAQYPLNDEIFPELLQQLNIKNWLEQQFNELDKEVGELKAIEARYAAASLLHRAPEKEEIGKPVILELDELKKRIERSYFSKKEEKNIFKRKITKERKNKYKIMRKGILKKITKKYSKSKFEHKPAELELTYIKDYPSSSLESPGPLCISEISGRNFQSPKYELISVFTEEDTKNYLKKAIKLLNTQKISFSELLTQAAQKVLLSGEEQSFSYLDKINTELRSVQQLFSLLSLSKNNPSLLLGIGLAAQQLTLINQPTTELLSLLKLNWGLLMECFSSSQLWNFYIQKTMTISIKNLSKLFNYIEKKINKENSDIKEIYKEKFIDSKSYNFIVSELVFPLNNYLSLKLYHDHQPLDKIMMYILIQFRPWVDQSKNPEIQSPEIQKKLDYIDSFLEDREIILKKPDQEEEEKLFFKLWKFWTNKEKTKKLSHGNEIKEMNITEMLTSLTFSNETLSNKTPFYLNICRDPLGRNQISTIYPSLQNMLPCSADYIETHLDLLPEEKSSFIPYISTGSDFYLTKEEVKFSATINKFLRISGNGISFNISGSKTNDFPFVVNGHLLFFVKSNSSKINYTDSNVKLLCRVRTSYIYIQKGSSRINLLLDHRFELSPPLWTQSFSELNPCGLYKDVMQFELPILQEPIKMLSLRDYGLVICENNIFVISTETKFTSQALSPVPTNQILKTLLLSFRKWTTQAKLNFTLIDSRILMLSLTSSFRIIDLDVFFNDVSIQLGVFLKKKGKLPLLYLSKDGESHTKLSINTNRSRKFRRVILTKFKGIESSMLALFGSELIQLRCGGAEKKDWQQMDYLETKEELEPTIRTLKLKKPDDEFDTLVEVGAEIRDQSLGRIQDISSFESQNEILIKVERKFGYELITETGKSSIQKFSRIRTCRIGEKTQLRNTWGFLAGLEHQNGILNENPEKDVRHDIQAGILRYPLYIKIDKKKMKLLIGEFENWEKLLQTKKSTKEESAQNSDLTEVGANTDGDECGGLILVLTEPGCLKIEPTKKLSFIKEQFMNYAVSEPAESHLEIADSVAYLDENLLDDKKEIEKISFDNLNQELLSKKGYYFVIKGKPKKYLQNLLKELNLENDTKHREFQMNLKQNIFSKTLKEIKNELKTENKEDPKIVNDEIEKIDFLAFKKNIKLIKEELNQINRRNDSNPSLTDLFTENDLATLYTFPEEFKNNITIKTAFAPLRWWNYRWLRQLTQNPILNNSSLDKSLLTDSSMRWTFKSLFADFRSNNVLNHDYQSIYLDRHKAKTAPRSRLANSLVGQYFFNIKKIYKIEELVYFVNQLEFNFMGESISFLILDGADDGGLLREYHRQVAEQLVDTYKLFIPTPNGRAEIGDEREKLIPDPEISWNELEFLRIVGSVIGVAFMIKDLVPISFSSLFYRNLLGEILKWEDIAFTDSNAFSNYSYLSKATDQQLSLLAQPFTTYISSGSEVPLLPYGRLFKLSNKNREEYLRLAKQLQMQLLLSGLGQLKLGFQKVVPAGKYAYYSPLEAASKINGDEKVNFYIKKRLILKN